MVTSLILLIGCLCQTETVVLGKFCSGSLSASPSIGGGLPCFRVDGELALIFCERLASYPPPGSFSVCQRWRKPCHWSYLALARSQ